MIKKQAINLVAASEIGTDPSLSNHAELAARCGAIVPLNWPAGGLTEVLSPCAGEDGREWDYWYALAHDTSLPRLAPFVAGGGAVSLSQHGTVQADIAFRLLPQFQGHNYGQLIAEALVEWVFAQGDCERICTTVSWEDGARVHILSKIGFVLLSGGTSASREAIFVLEKS